MRTARGAGSEWPGSAPDVLQQGSRPDHRPLQHTLLTADGAKIVTATALSPRHHPRLGYEEITEFSVRASQPVLSQDRFSAPVGYQDVLWASPDGSALVISDPPGREDSERSRNIFGVLAGNRFTPIRRGAHTSNQVAW